MSFVPHLLIGPKESDFILKIIIFEYMFLAATKQL